MFLKINKKMKLKKTSPRRMLYLVGIAIGYYLGLLCSNAMIQLKLLAVRSLQKLRIRDINRSFFISSLLQGHYTCKGLFIPKSLLFSNHRYITLKPRSLN